MENNSNTCDNQITPLGHAMNNEEQRQHTQNPPLPFSATMHLTQEELQSLVDEYGRRIKEYEDNRRAKRKQKAQRERNVSNSHKRLLDEMLMIQEQYNAKGLVYGIVTETSKSVTGVSDSLKEWWTNQAMFEKTGPVEIEKYNKEHSLFINLDPENEAKPTTELLMEQSDPTLDA